MSAGKTKNVAAFYLLGFIVVTAILDVWLYYNGGTEATISHQVWVWSPKYPMFVLSVGIVLGHLFWPRRCKCPESEEK